MGPVLKNTIVSLLIVMIIAGCAGRDAQKAAEQSRPAPTALPEAWARIRSDDYQRTVGFVFDTANTKLHTAMRIGKDTSDSLMKHFIYRLQHAIKNDLEAKGFVLDPAAITQYEVTVENLTLDFSGTGSLAPMRAKSAIRVDIKRSKHQILVSRRISAEALGPQHFTYNFKEYSRLISKNIEKLVPQAFSEPVLEALAKSTDPAGFAEAVTDRPPAAAAVRDESVSPAAPYPAGDHQDLDFGNYHALVIGNNEYLLMPGLKTAVNDAQAVANILNSRYGFSVETLYNATRSDILRALGRYRRTLSINDNLLIYYAGHGWLDMAGDEGYWLPVDAEIDIETNWISNSYMTTTLRAIEAKHVIVIADSCYSGKLTRGVNITDRSASYLAQIVRKRSRTVLSSGGLEPVLDSGGKNNHSVFASAFIEALSENNGVVDATQIFSIIRRAVMLNSYQTPEYADIRSAGHDGGDFLFVPLASAK
ncbi:MAG: caspase family protein [Desulfobacterales bacterium]|jgi:hypothetical protein|nr:caspase family protein [Deltaproteobacteria bacterium]